MGVDVSHHTRQRSFVWRVCRKSCYCFDSSSLGLWNTSSIKYESNQHSFPPNLIAVIGNHLNSKKKDNVLPISVSPNTIIIVLEPWEAVVHLGRSGIFDTNFVCNWLLSVIDLLFRCWNNEEQTMLSTKAIWIVINLKFLWIIERTNSPHNQFSLLFVKVEWLIHWKNNN